VGRGERKERGKSGQNTLYTCMKRIMKTYLLLKGGRE
jgi:hypothetical protein